MLKTCNPIRIKACFSLVCAAVLFLHPFKLSNVKISGHIVTSTEFVTVGYLFALLGVKKHICLSAVCKEPPYKVEESGYAGFLMPIEVYFKNKVRIPECIRKC